MDLGKYTMGAAQNNLPLHENDMQELWELNGRVKALIAYAKLRPFVSPEEIIAMLGGDADGLPMHENK